MYVRIHTSAYVYIHIHMYVYLSVCVYTGINLDTRKSHKNNNQRKSFFMSLFSSKPTNCCAKGCKHVKLGVENLVDVYIYMYTYIYVDTHPR